MIFVQMKLSLFDILEFQIAFCQTGMSFHLFELERILPLFFISSFFILSSLIIVADRLLKFYQILLLILDTSLVLALQVVQLSYFMRYSSLALSFSCSLSYGECTFIRFQCSVKLKFYQLLRFFNVNLD